MEQKLKEQLLAELSRRNIDIVVLWVEENPQYIDILVDYVLSNDKKLSPRAAWALDHINSNGKLPLQQYVNKLIPHFSKLKYGGARRCISKLLITHSIPYDYEGEILDYCLKAMGDAKEPLAVKANCMAVIFNILPKYPDLKNEVFAIIEDQMPHNTVGFKSRFNVLKRKFK